MAGQNNSSWDKKSRWGQASGAFSAPGMAAKGAKGIICASAPESPVEQQQRVEQASGKRMPVNLPVHLFTPAGAQSLDVRRVISVPAGTENVEILRLNGVPGRKIHIMAYAVYTDALDAQFTEFKPRINNAAGVFPFHGDPNDNFKINLGLAPDLSNISLIECQLTLTPTDVMVWYAKNTDTTAHPFGVRMRGYVDASTERRAPRTGG